MAHSVQPSAELVWQAEQNDLLAPYKTDEELAMQADNTFYAQLETDSVNKTNAVVKVLQNKQEGEVEIVGKGPTRRSKYDYLEKWREMYRHGTLEVPERPLLRFGRSPDDHHDTMAATVRDWYRRNKKSPLTEDQLARSKVENEREKEAKCSMKNLKQAKRAKRIKVRTHKL
ncbi:unnamed protein product [Phytomonas sp. Hart1]|nr:unnamed protein product [Phytomonas sp. Hart1]|eukprot:CCW66359.1 unnamed protein product [Phytomonas sp. isolate Hart1]